MRHHAFLIRWTRLTWGILVSACALAALGTSVAQASPPCHVPSTAYPTIQSAINDDTCDTINVAAGTYTENVFIRRSVTIRGADEATTIVDGGGNGTVFEIFATGGVTIKNVTIRNGASGGTGGGIDMCCTASLTLLNSTVSGNHATGEGGGIFVCCGSSLTIKNSIVSDNHTDSEGGGIFGCCGGSLTLQNSTVSDNSAGTTGGGIVAIAGIEVSLTRTEVVNNTPNN